MVATIDDIRVSLAEFEADNAIQDLPSVAKAFGVDASSRLGKWCYWRKASAYPSGDPTPDGGWIVTAQWHPTESERQREKGMVPLAGQYGIFDPIRNPQGWNAHRERFRGLFAAGGAKEFPVDQIIAYGWHRKPPYKTATFPQMQGVEVTDEKCKTCGAVKTVKVVYADGTVDDRSFVMEDHVRTAHRESAQQEKAAKALAIEMNKVNGPTADALLALARSLNGNPNVDQALAERDAEIARLRSELDSKRARREQPPAA